MKKRKVIKNVPTKLPIQGTVFYLMWFFDATDFWWGVFIVVFVILWALIIIAKINEQKVDLNDFIDMEGPEKKKESEVINFSDRINNALNKEEDEKN